MENCLTAYQEKLRRLAEKGFIKTPETHPAEYAEYLNASAGLLRQLEEIASEYMGDPLDGPFAISVTLAEYGDDLEDVIELDAA